MTLATTTSAPWMILSTGYLESFLPHTACGTLIAPRLYADGAEARGRPDRMVILDGNGARELETSSLLVLEELERYWKVLPAAERRTPADLPGMGGWRLAGFATGAAAFSKGACRIEIECRDRSVRYYSVRWTSPAAEVGQRIAVDAEGHGVATHSYSFRMRFPNFKKAVEFAWLVSALIYESGQYADGDLGPLMLRRDAPGEEAPVRPGQPGDVPWDLLTPADEIAFVSGRSVFEASPQYREAVATAGVSPASGGRYDVGIDLYRPPQRPFERMPLKPRLRATLWDPLQAKILPPIPSGAGSPYRVHG